MSGTGAVTDAPHRRITLEEVRAHRDAIERIAAEHGVHTVRVFGSVARGEAEDDSDLDLLVDTHPGTSLWDVTGFALDIEALLNVFTQVSTSSGLKARIREQVVADAVAV